MCVCGGGGGGDLAHLASFLSVYEHSMNLILSDVVQSHPLHRHVSANVSPHQLRGVTGMYEPQGLPIVRFSILCPQL